MLDSLNFTWHWSPFSLAALLMLCLLYGFGIFRVRRTQRSHTLKPYQIAAFILAVVLIAIVFFTPLDTIARTQLFSAHMLQVVILTTLCAPLLLGSCPNWLFQPLVQQSLLGRLFRFFTHPLVASMLFNAVFLLWHEPGLFHFALQDGIFYHIELWSLLVAALLNWWPLIGPLRSLQRLSYPQQMLYAFLDGQPVDIFAFLLVFTGVVFYPYYATPDFILSPGHSTLTDQLAGGALLLIPGLVDLVVMTPLFFRWLGQLEKQARIDDQRRQKEAEEEEVRLAEENERDVMGEFSQGSNGLSQGTRKGMPLL